MLEGFCELADTPVGTHLSPAQWWNTSVCDTPGLLMVHVWNQGACPCVASSHPCVAFSAAVPSCAVSLRSQTLWLDTWHGCADIPIHTSTLRSHRTFDATPILHS